MADAAVRSKKPATSKRTPAGGAPTAPHSADEASEPRIDVSAVTDMLLGTWADTRREAREMLKDPAFHRVDGLSMDEHRERVLSQLHLLVENGGVHRAFPKAYGGEEDNGANIAGFEELVTADPSLQIKSGVQWGLFGSAVLQLGTKEHHDKWLPGIMNLEIPGAFAMTETGTRLGCRRDRHHGDLRRRHRGVRHPHAVPRRLEGLPRQRGTARHRRDRLRAAHHERRQPRRALLLRAAPR